MIVLCLLVAGGGHRGEYSQLATLSRIQGVFVETKPVRDEAFRG